MRSTCREIVKYRPAKGTRDDSGAAIVLSGVGAGRRTLYFWGHYDVAPVTTAGQCAPSIKGKTLFGRGSADMKGGLASMLYAAVVLRRLRVPLDGRVGLVFVPDEETGGHRGSGFLAATKRLGTHGIGMLTPEPTGGVKHDPAAVDAYLANLRTDERQALERLRKLIRETVPHVEERVSYGTAVMFSLGRDLVGFVSQPKHLSFFMASAKLALAMKREIAKTHAVSGATIHFSPDNPLPTSLVKKIVRARARENASLGRVSER